MCSAEAQSRLWPGDACTAAAVCHALGWTCNLWFLYKVAADRPVPPLPIFQLRQCEVRLHRCDAVDAGAVYNNNLDPNLVNLLEEAEEEVVVFSAV